ARAGAGLCEPILNRTNRYHGPGMSQALSHCASRAVDGDRPWLWLLDSDCVVARPDAATEAVSAARSAGAALLGEAAWNTWHQDVRLRGYSLLIDPARAWRPEIGPVREGGDPVGDFEQSCRRVQIPIATFPFTASGFIVHLGRGTLNPLAVNGNVAIGIWTRRHDCSKSPTGSPPSRNGPISGRQARAGSIRS